MLEANQLFYQVSLAHLFIALPFPQQPILVGGFQGGSFVNGPPEELLFLRVHAFGLLKVHRIRPPGVDVYRCFGAHLMAVSLQVLVFLALLHAAHDVDALGFPLQVQKLTRRL